MEILTSKEVGLIIKKLMQIHKIRSKDIYTKCPEEIGLTTSHKISKLINGYRYPSYAEFVYLSSLLKVTPDYFFNQDNLPKL
jgi:transcriptional regulator with XRE-family HTH domain